MSNFRQLAKKSVDAILEDLSDRGGCDFFHDLDEEIQEEIKETWIKILMENLSDSKRID